MYEQTDWDAVGELIAQHMGNNAEIDTQDRLDETIERFTKITADAVEELTPLANPCPYSKRWFTPDLKEKQRVYNKARRKWQTSTARLGRDHQATQEMFSQMQRHRKEWAKAIEHAKSKHWKDFLDRAADGNLIWKAAKYAEPSTDYANIPPLYSGEQMVIENEDKAKLLMETFFPPTSSPSLSDDHTEVNELPWEPISEREIYLVLARAKDLSAPGDDGIPCLVWKKTWKHVSSIVTNLFEASLSLRYHPKAWRTATIVVLRKSGKPNYTNPSAYRPISLLNTLGKLLEATIAKRMSYYVENYNLLPNTQFGGRPGRSTEQALLILVDAIWKAWRQNKVVTLMALDIKGAFNGVNRLAMDHLLRGMGIPKIAREWTNSFMKDRWACIKFDGYCSDKNLLAFPGLAQGSPYSPILYTIYNQKLVNQMVDDTGGASAFIDDYFRWHCGASAAENVQKLQTEDIPRMKLWAEQTGSTFETGKTELIHFTRARSKQVNTSIEMDGQVIAPSESVKLLGVMFDTELRWRAHAQRISKRATSTCIGISRLRHLRPKQMRQLYQACVVPKLDYASTVWYRQGRVWQTSILRKIQRKAAIRIISAFRTVATETLDIEANLLPTHLRLKQRALNVLGKLKTLPSNHPIWPIVHPVEAFSARNAMHSPLMLTIATAAEKSLFQNLETISPAPMLPWGESPFASIKAVRSRAEAKITTQNLVLTDPGTVIFTDGSGKGNDLGAAAIVLGRNQDIRHKVSIGVGSNSFWNVYAAELIAIFFALHMARRDHIWNTVNQNPSPSQYTILSDSKAALQAIANPQARSAQHIIHRILTDAERLSKGCDIALHLAWVPGHEGIQGNEVADHEAKAALERPLEHHFAPLLSSQKRKVKELIRKQWREEWNNSPKGQHLRKLDPNLPGKHVHKLYDARPRRQANLLAQIRTGHSWLKSYRKRFGKAQDDICECGARETLTHVFIDCPRLRGLRQRLRRRVGPGLNSISSMISEDIADGELNAILEFAEESGRFCNRDLTQQH
jgi:ribonuclease HI